MELFISILLGFLFALALVALRRRMAEFPGQKPDDYAEGFPEFDLKEHLNGRMICDGVIFGPMGRVTSSFVAEFDIVWEENVAVMKEHFRYNDGSTQNRQWTITLGRNGAFTATAPDVPGKARGKQTGSSVRMLYRIRLPESAGAHVLDTVDWMYLTPDGTIMNRSQFRKFGMKVAELVAAIRPAP